MRRIWTRISGDEGSATAEYALIALVAAVLAGVLFTVVSGQSVATAISGLIERALSVRF